MSRRKRDDPVELGLKLVFGLILLVALASGDLATFPTRLVSLLFTLVIGAAALGVLWLIGRFIFRSLCRVDYDQTTSSAPSASTFPPTMESARIGAGGNRLVSVREVLRGVGAKDYRSEFIMGLDLSVGYLADVAQHDAEGAADVRADFERLNQFLRSQRLPAHYEPEDVVPFSCQMYGYGGLHYLRRIAAHLADGRPLPSPGEQNASKDPVLARRYAEEPGGKSIFHRLFARKRSAFDHLINHSDAEGYYLPQDFPDVLVANPDEWKIPGALIGSSPRLVAECQQLAATLELPLHLDPESEEMWDALDQQGQGDIKWKRYGVESFTCLRLHAAAKHSVATGAALVFC